MKVLAAVVATAALVLAPAAARAAGTHKAHHAKKSVSTWSGGVVQQPTNQKWIYTPRF